MQPPPSPGWVAVQSPLSGWAAADCGYMCRLVEQELYRNQGLRIAGAPMRAWGTTDVTEKHVSSASIIIHAVLSYLRSSSSFDVRATTLVHPAELQTTSHRVFSSASQ